VTSRLVDEPRAASRREPSTTDRRNSREQSFMSKPELMESIMRINRSARREFLVQFSENELQDYLRQLEAVAPARQSPQPTAC